MEKINSYLSCMEAFSDPPEIKITDISTRQPKERNIVHRNSHASLFLIYFRLLTSETSFLRNIIKYSIVVGMFFFVIQRVAKLFH